MIQGGLVFRKSALVNGAQAIIGYAVQPVDAPPFEFLILGGAFGSLASAGAGRPGMSIETGAGRVTNYGGIVQIEGLVDASAYAALGTLIEEHLVAHQLPLVRNLYQRGQAVAFGKLCWLFGTSVPKNRRRVPKYREWACPLKAYAGG